MSSKNSNFAQKKFFMPSLVSDDKYRKFMGKQLHFYKNYAGLKEKGEKDLKKIFLKLFFIPFLSLWF